MGGSFLLQVFSLKPALIHWTGGENCLVKYISRRFMFDFGLKFRPFQNLFIHSMFIAGKNVIEALS
jgi:hypothetical protein